MFEPGGIRLISYDMLSTALRLCYPLDCAAEEMRRKKEIEKGEESLNYMEY
jgi:hypothetical protein